MRNIKLTIEYDGTGYCGWQVQPNGVSVQEVLQKAIRKMTGEKAMLQGASRTDAGVHAFGQAANFRTGSKIACANFVNGLNSLLPDDISVLSAEEMPLSFHAKRDSKGKHYRYIIMTGMAKPALLHNRVWFAKKSFNASRLNKAAQALVGEHDFSAFCASGDANKSKVRRVDSIKVNVILRPQAEGSHELHCVQEILRSAQDDIQLITIDIVGDGFLKYMVRNIVGTLIKFQNSSLTPIGEVLEGRDRKKAGVTAPACGLYLVEVFY